MLTGSKKRLTTEDKGIPQRQSSILELLYDEPLPGIVLQYEITEKPIVRDIYAKLIGKGPPRLSREQIVERQQCSASQNHGPEEHHQESQQANHHCQIKQREFSRQWMEYLSRRVTMGDYTRNQGSVNML